MSAKKQATNTDELFRVTTLPVSAEATTPPAADNAPMPPPVAAPPAPPVKKQREIIAVMRVKYGAVEIEYGIRSLVEPTTLAGQNAEFDKLTAQLETAHDLYAVNRLPRFKDRGSIEYGKQKKDFKPAAKTGGG